MGILRSFWEKVNVHTPDMDAVVTVRCPVHLHPCLPERGPPAEGRLARPHPHSARTHIKLRAPNDIILTISNFAASPIIATLTQHNPIGLSSRLTGAKPASMATGVDAKLLKSTKFPPEFNRKVDMQKVNIQVMKK